MLSPWDDYPIHQTSYPVALPVGSDAGRYDRHWLTMHDTALTTQLGVGMSVHPNRGIIDAALSISRAGEQRSVYASSRLGQDRDTVCGPLRIEVVEPMRTLRVVLEDHEGVSADLTWTGVTQTVIDGRMERWAGPTLVSERTRTVQFGAWSGSFAVDGETTAVSPETWWGLRDRSWGSRTTGTVAEGVLAASLSNIYFAWTLLRFDDECLLVAVNEMPDGRSESRTVAVLPFLAPGDPAYGEDDVVVRSDDFVFDIDYLPGTRRASSIELTVGPRGSVDRRVQLEPLLTFQMKGLGYGHPRWKHGADHGGEVVGADSWLLSECDANLKENLHVQQLVRATRSDGAVGLGLFEHVAIGPHLPTGLPDGLVPRC
jgi:hypothetical protein